MTPAGAWVIETKARWLQKNRFSAALKQTANNVVRGRGHLRTDLPVRDCQSLRIQNREFEAEHNWRGEPVVCLDAKSLWRRLGKERRAVVPADYAEVARVRKLVWNLGSAAHMDDG